MRLASLCLSVACFLVGLTGCKEQPADLKEAVEGYYAAVQSEDWKTVFEYRTESFRHTVEKTHFIESMDVASLEWSLEGYTVVNVKNVDEDQYAHEVELTISHVSGEGKQLFKIVQEDIWVSEDGRWQIYRSPSMMHLPFTE